MTWELSPALRPPRHASISFCEYLCAKLLPFGHNVWIIRFDRFISSLPLPCSMLLPEESIREVVKDCMDAWNKHDAKALASLYAEDDQLDGSRSDRQGCHREIPRTSLCH